MQNKPKVNMGNIDKIRPVHVFARAGNLAITIYDFTRGNLSPYKGGQNELKLLFTSEYEKNGRLAK
jgi:hypothetical protein